MKDIQVLVVSRESAISRTMKTAFPHFNITALSEPEKIVSAVKENEFHVVVVDYMMARMNGIDLLLYLRKVTDFYAAILLTTNDEKIILEKTVNKNLIYKILLKPIDIDLLEDTIEQAAGHYSSWLEKKKERDVTPGK